MEICTRCSPAMTSNMKIQNRRLWTTENVLKSSHRLNFELPRTQVQTSNMFTLAHFHTYITIWYHSHHSENRFKFYILVWMAFTTFVINIQEEPLKLNNTLTVAKIKTGNMWNCDIRINIKMIIMYYYPVFVCE